MIKKVFSDKRSIVIIAGIAVCCVVSFVSSRIFPQEVSKIISFSLTFAIIYLCSVFSRLVSVIAEQQNEKKRN